MFDERSRLEEEKKKGDREEETKSASRVGELVGFSRKSAAGAQQMGWGSPLKEFSKGQKPPETIGGGYCGGGFRKGGCMDREASCGGKSKKCWIF